MNLNSRNGVKKLVNHMNGPIDSILELLITLKGYKKGYYNQGDLDPKKMSLIMKYFSDYDMFLDDYDDQSWILSTRKNISNYLDKKISLGELLGYGACADTLNEKPKISIKFKLIPFEDNFLDINEKIEITGYMCSERIFNNTKTEIQKYAYILSIYFEKLELGHVEVEFLKK
jgi:hypothetical protein